MNQVRFNNAFKQLTFRRREVLQKFLAGETDAEIAKSLHITESTVRQHIKALCKAFDLKNDFPDERHSKRSELTDLCTQYKPELRMLKNNTPDQNFVGREGAISDINDLIIKPGSRIVVIQASGGVGKTTLAQQYLKTQEFDLVLELLMAKEKENITSVESVIEEWLKREFQEEPGREFGVTLGRLKRQLQNRKIGILIDNLEPALDKQGKFIEPHRSYIELLRVLADPMGQSVTLITSRDRLCEADIAVKHYRLLGLDEAAWQLFFSNSSIKIDSLTLKAMHKAYGGNAKAMDILCGAINEDFDGSMTAYWQENQVDLLVKADLANLVASQFNRLQQIDPEAYSLLCRLGCYRYQDVPTVPIKGLLCLLWDVEEVKSRRTIESLRNRSLVEFKNGECYLHPAIRAEAITRLRASEDWKSVNRRIAVFYDDLTLSIDNNLILKIAFEAVEHFYEIEDFNNCCQTLLFKILGAEKIENLRCTPNLWNGAIRIITISEKLLGKLPDQNKALILIPLGIIYTESGMNRKAIEVSRQILNITNNIKKCEKLAFAEICSYLIAGKANRLIGNFNESKMACEKATEIAQRSGNFYWKSLALYELGSLYIETSKPGRALRCFIVAAFQAVGYKIPLEIYSLSQLLFEPVESLSFKINEIFKKYNTNNIEEDRSKKSAILWNISRCFNTMKLHRLAKIVSDINSTIVNETDKNFVCWLSLEYAIYYSAIGNQEQANKYYQKALEASADQGYSWCRVHALMGYANWKYTWDHYEDALAIHNNLETPLKNNEFYNLQAHNYHCLSLIYLKTESFDRVTEYLKKSQDICEELSLPLLNQLAETHYQLALVYQKMGEVEKSQTNFHEAIQLFHKIEAPKQAEKLVQAMSGRSQIKY